MSPPLSDPQTSDYALGVTENSGGMVAFLFIYVSENRARLSYP